MGKIIQTQRNHIVVLAWFMMQNVIIQWLLNILIEPIK